MYEKGWGEGCGYRRILYNTQQSEEYWKRASCLVGVMDSVIIIQWVQDNPSSQEWDFYSSILYGSTCRVKADGFTCLDKDRLTILSESSPTFHITPTERYYISSGNQTDIVFYWPKATRSNQEEHCSLCLLYISSGRQQIPGVLGKHFHP